MAIAPPCAWFASFDHTDSNDSGCARVLAIGPAVIAFTAVVVNIALGDSYFRRAARVPAFPVRGAAITSLFFGRGDNGTR
ncbi:hypothetical protein [Nocardia sp. NPDC052112]|uniref:hypothetical protein n=1 Tax=Nocardia sp. NPDC052112 TaxID=3155646 RepID=UPI00343C636F